MKRWSYVPGLALAVVGLMLIMGAVPNLSAGPTSPGLPAPRVAGTAAPGRLPFPTPPSSSSTLLPSGAPTATSAPQGSSSPVRCPTPQNAPDWNSPIFFDDALVSFSVPGQANLSGGNFQTVPCTNALPTYLNGFWMNVTTNVPILAGFVTIWGTAWPTPNSPYAPLPGFSYQGTPVSLPMYVNPSAPNSAAFYFNIYKYFVPGSTVWFNVTLQSQYAAPTVITSASQYAQPSPFTTSPNNATWEFQVLGPWWSTNFSNDIQIVSTPSVTSAPYYPPNPLQSVAIMLESTGPSGALGPGIPEALLTFNLTGNFTGTYSIAFSPVNHTFENLSTALGPYPDTHVTFNVTAWMVWRGGEIDPIFSPTYNFTWGSAGAWPNRSAGLADNAQISASPNVFAPGGAPLPSGQPVNITLHESMPNVTISQAVVNFRYAFAGGSAQGNVPMRYASANTTYYVLPGLPSGASLEFSLLAKDVYGDALTSGNTTYYVVGPPSPSPPNGTGLIFVQAEDLTTLGLATGFNFTLSNRSWTESAVASPIGVGTLAAPSGNGYLFLYPGSYTLTVTVGGHRISVPISLDAGGTVSVVIPYSTGPFPATSLTYLPVLSIGIVLGLVALALITIPLFRMYRARRAQVEAEQKRITL